MKNVQTKHEVPLPELPPSFDRRQRDRIDIKIPLRVLSYGLLAEKADTVICNDLGEGGLSFDCDAELNVGDIVIIEFPQKGEAPYRCHARLMYRLGRRYGAYFLTGE